jgi:hypothetical protein
MVVRVHCNERGACTAFLGDLLLGRRRALLHDGLGRLAVSATHGCEAFGAMGAPASARVVPSPASAYTLPCCTLCAHRPPASFSAPLTAFLAIKTLPSRAFDVTSHFT